jgi:crossover junction endodeoxyribonuclease RusA
MAEIVLEFDWPAEALSMNEGASYAVRVREQAWRDAAHWYWIQAHPGEGPSGRTSRPAEVSTVICFRQKRRRDPINYAATVKRIVDGLVLAGAWPDDTDEYVTQHIPSLLITGRDSCVVRIRERSTP